MISKEVQLSLSFCGALAAILLISAPLNETTSLVGSGIAFLISGGFFYGGISKYFTDKEKQAQIVEEQAKLLIKSFDESISQSQKSMTAQIKDVVDAVGNLNDTLSHSIQKPIVDLQNSTNAQVKNIVEVIGNLNDTLNYSIQKSTAELQNSTNAQLKEVVDAIENLDDSLNDSIGSPIGEIFNNLSTMADTVKLIQADTENIVNHANKLKELNKTAKEILDNIEDLSKNITEVSNVDETLQELLRTMNHQEEFYQTTLSQYKNMTLKDVELIENLARKLR